MATPMPTSPIGAKEIAEAKRLNNSVREKQRLLTLFSLAHEKENANYTREYKVVTMLGLSKLYYKSYKELGIEQLIALKQARYWHNAAFQMLGKAVDPSWGVKDPIPLPTRQEIAVEEKQAFQLLSTAAAQGNIEAMCADYAKHGFKYLLEEKLWLQKELKILFDIRQVMAEQGVSIQAVSSFIIKAAKRISEIERIFDNHGVVRFPDDCERFLTCTPQRLSIQETTDRCVLDVVPPQKITAVAMLGSTTAAVRVTTLDADTKKESSALALWNVKTGERKDFKNCILPSEPQDERFALAASTNQFLAVHFYDAKDRRDDVQIWKYEANQDQPDYQTGQFKHTRTLGLEAFDGMWVLRHGFLATLNCVSARLSIWNLHSGECLDRVPADMPVVPLSNGGITVGRTRYRPGEEKCQIVNPRPYIMQADRLLAKIGEDVQVVLRNPSELANFVMGYMEGDAVYVDAAVKAAQERLPATVAPPPAKTMAVVSSTSFATPAVDEKKRRQDDAKRREEYFDVKRKAETAKGSPSSGSPTSSPASTSSAPVPTPTP
jgi:hypothetical protein